MSTAPTCVPSSSCDLTTDATSTPRWRVSFGRLSLALTLGLVASFGLAACEDEEPEESCYEQMDADETGSGLICGTDQQQRVALTAGRPSDLHSACVPLEQCPDYCPVEDVNQSVILPSKDADDPEFVVDEVIPLCVEIDPAAGNCCFWALLIEAEG